ncbi:DUF89 family protein [bacterium]|nr:DUF89 family protein [bacterium]
MKSTLDCIPCFFKQALETARLAGADVHQQRLILDDVARVMAEFDHDSPPPEMSRHIYRAIRERTGVADPFLKIKEESNRIVLDIYDQLMLRTETSPDPLRTAVELAIAGNIIDYGATTALKIDQELERILADEYRAIQEENSSLFRFDEFKSSLINATELLYIADNAGEIVFDRVLLQVIRSQFPQIRIRFAVREIPAINDVLMQDAEQCRISDLAEVISSGSDGPGTFLEKSGETFLKIFNEADMIIAKGQGNYETLSETNRPIYFLLLVKCSVIASHIGCRVGNIILSQNGGM